MTTHHLNHRHLRRRRSSLRSGSQSPLQRIQHVLHSHPVAQPADGADRGSIVFTIINPRLASPRTSP